MTAQTNGSIISSSAEKAVIISFLGFIVIVAGGPVAMRATFTEMAPFWVATSRFGLGAHMYTWTAFIYLVVFLTLVGFLLYAFVLGNWPASRTSYGFVIVPLGDDGDCINIKRGDYYNQFSDRLGAGATRCAYRRPSAFENSAGFDRGM